MLYGMYLSAAGLIASSYRQDVIANNIANSETTGFKRDLALLQQRPTPAEGFGPLDDSGDPMLDSLGTGIFASPTTVDTSQGELEPTGNNLDIGLQGSGYFGVSNNGQVRLTRNGQFLVNAGGQLVMADNAQETVLDPDQKPIQISGTLPVTIGSDGTIMQGGKAVDKIGTFNVADPAALRKDGDTMLSFPQDSALTPASPTYRSGYIERSNVEPTTELTELMEMQRQLEANANMIKYQDETLDKLVNDVGKIS
jgi:flagellar basal body rod protein FlgG